MAGVVLIAQPEFVFGTSSEPNPEQLSGVLYTLGGAITLGCSLTIIRATGKVEPLVGVFSYVVHCCVIAGVAFYVQGDYVIPCAADLPLFFSLGLLGNTCQFFITKSLQHERPSTVGVMRSIEIILTYIVQVGGFFSNNLNVFWYSNKTLYHLFWTYNKINKKISESLQSRSLDFLSFFVFTAKLKL